MINAPFFHKPESVLIFKSTGMEDEVTYRMLGFKMVKHFVKDVCFLEWLYKILYSNMYLL